MQNPLEEPQKVQKGGSQFADVSNYLSQNADQGKRLASDVGQSVVDAGNKARTATQDAQKSFGQAVNASTVPYNESIAQRAKTDPRSFYSYQAPQSFTNKKGGGNNKKSDFSNIVNYLSQQQPKFGGGNQPISPAFAPAQDTTGNAADVSEFERMRDAAYTGPMDLTADPLYGQALEAEQGAAEASGNVLTDVGRQDLLSNLGPSGIGAGALDQLLLGGGRNQDILSRSAAQNTDVTGGLDRANESARAEALKAQETTDATRERIQSDMFGDDGAFRTLQSSWNNNQNRRGGKNWREAQNYRSQVDEQKLDALNRLMGTTYNTGDA